MCVCIYIYVPIYKCQSNRDQTEPFKSLNRKGKFWGFYSCSHRPVIKPCVSLTSETPRFYGNFHAAGRKFWGVQGQPGPVGASA